MELIKKRINESIEVKKRVLDDEALLRSVQSAADLIFDCLSAGKKVLLCGNGGSASDALHLAGELVGRFQRERKAMAAVCLNADVATMTAIANDYGYDRIFERGVEGLIIPGDILIGISTSGNSENVYLAALKARELGGRVIALLGRDGGKIAKQADVPIVIPCDNTARIQESHIMLGHIICELVEDAYAVGLEGR